MPDTALFVVARALARVAFLVASQHPVAYGLLVLNAGLALHLAATTWRDLADSGNGGRS